MENFCILATVILISVNVQTLYVSIHRTYFVNFIEAIGVVQPIQQFKRLTFSSEYAVMH